VGLYFPHALLLDGFRTQDVDRGYPQKPGVTRLKTRADAGAVRLDHPAEKMGRGLAVG